MSEANAIGDPPSSAWRLRYAAHLGVRSIAQPLFEHSAGSIDPVAQIRYAAQLGFSAIFDNGLKLRPVAEQERIGSELARLGLAMGSFVSNFDLAHKTPWNVRDEAARAHIRAEIRESIAAARRVNGRVVTVVSGMDETLDRQTQIEALTDHLKEVAELAEQGGIVLAIEPVSSLRVPGLLIRHLREVEAIATAVGSPALGVIFDTHHVRAMDGDVEANFARAASLVAAVQLGDFPERYEPGTGTIAFARFFRQLRAAGYGGLVELEFSCSQPGAAGEQAAVAALRRLDQSL